MIIRSVQHCMCRHLEVAPQQGSAARCPKCTSIAIATMHSREVTYTGQRPAQTKNQVSYLSGSTAKQVDSSATYDEGAQFMIYEIEPGADFAIMNRKRTGAATYALNLPFYISASATDPSGDMVLILSGGNLARYIRSPSFN